MNETILHYLILCFAMVITVLSAYGVVAPGSLTDWVMGEWEKRYAMPLAVGVRLLLGIVILLAAESSRFPTVFIVIGWIMIIAAILIPMAGKDRVGKLISWLNQQPPILVRIWCSFGVLFGLFLGYGVNLL